MRVSKVAIAGGFVSCMVPTQTLANADTLLCTTDSGVEIMSLTRHGSSVIEATYLDEGEPTVLEIEQLYSGGTVIGLQARYSPMLGTRLEVTRDFAAGATTYRGKIWPIAASNAWDVTCTVQQ